MNVNPKGLSFLIFVAMFSLIATTTSAQPNLTIARKVVSDVVTPAKIAGQELPKPEPPKPEQTLTTPYVSELVAPADTRSLPLTSFIVPDVGEILEFPRYSLRSRYRGAASARRVYDPVVQTSPSKPNMPLPMTNWEGISNLTLGRIPPDTDGQVGPDHYVQIVNWNGGSKVRVWNKAGMQLYDFSLGSLWPVTDTCRTDASGDPIVLYDQLAGRWLLTQFALPDPPYYECIAVSKTGTPTDDPNDWWLYSFRVHETKMNDYPKFGIWPDGYYMSVNQFVGNDWGGAGVYVFDRAAMLSGASATFQYFDLWDLDPEYGGLLPSNLMGNKLPPTGAPNYFMSVDMDWDGSTSDVMHVFEFHTDWTNPLSSTFGWVSNLVVAPFDWEICGSGYCIHQPDDAPLLDDLSDRLMMHLWYRNLGDHESLVVNHTVDAGSGQAGIRWYEIRGGTVDTTLADAVIYQQGTYAPDDGEHRWMGSIAMDGVGNIALGYSVSSIGTYPSIRYAGRQVGDPLDMLPEAEVEIISGNGTQTHSAARWGDYSAMSVDPVDDCTFWYTQEYVETTGLRSWQTRVASFQFPSCSLEPHGVLMGVVSDSVTLAPVAGAMIRATASPTRGYQTSTGADGTYTVVLYDDTYTITASALGYQPVTVGLVDVFSGTTTMQDFYLPARPQPAWTKTVYVDGVPVIDLSNIIIAPDSTIEIVDRVQITHTDSVTFTLVEKWTESLEMIDYALHILPGGTLLLPGSPGFPGLDVITATGVVTWEIAGLPWGWNYVLSKTFGVVEGVWTRDTITESLWVEDADPQLDDVKLYLLHEQKIYLPLVTRSG
ncbi:MAG: carboxypeptidase regulatory-like domain-containing protein [Chloroflexi bacterium]|nr:carboxypeptidase regulatory-like domain-containing protein [Chloroflexota bacterium]